MKSRRAWLVADGDGAEPDLALLGPEADWVLRTLTRRWQTIAKRLADPVAVVEDLARIGAIEIDCRLTGALGLDGYAGWRLVGWAREEAQRRQSAATTLRTDLELELREDHLVKRLREGNVPRGMSWADFVRVLRGAEKWLDLRAHRTDLPQERELAVHAAADSKWAWTEPRRALLSELVGNPEAVFGPKPRIIRAQGNVDGLRTNLFDGEVETVRLRLSGPVRAIVCVENLQTFNALYQFADADWWVLHVPGYPPVAERRALARVHALVPSAPVFAAFDPDPYGVEIALLLQSESNVALRADLMAPALLSALPTKALSDEDRQRVEGLRGRAGAFEPLRAAIAERGVKGEQEGAHPWLTSEIRRIDLELA